MDKFKIGIVVADDCEYKPLAEFIEKNTDFSPYSFLGRVGHSFSLGVDNKVLEVVSVLCGIGKVNAAAAAMHLADIGCNVILNYGLSGGISNISKGELVVCTEFLEHDFDLTGLGYKPFEKPSQKYIYSSDKYLNMLFSKVAEAKYGMAVSGDRFICDDSQREYFKNNFGAMSCDMETAAIAYVCSFSDIPFFALRRISDDAGDDAKESYCTMNTAEETVLSDLIIDFIKEIAKSDFIGKSYAK